MRNGQEMKGLSQLLVLLAVATPILMGVVHAARPGTVFYDDFNDGRADRWVAGQGDWSVASLAKQSITISLKNAANYGIGSVTDGTYCQGEATLGHKISHVKGSDYGDFDTSAEAMVISSPTRERELGLVFRAAGGQNFYHLRWYMGHTVKDDHLEIWKYVNGQGVLLGQIGTDYVPSGTRLVFKLSVKGDRFDAQVLAKGKGTSSSKRLSVTDATYTGGLFGIATYAGAGCFDNVQVTTGSGGGK